jgi:hypothetical protein
MAQPTKYTITADIKLCKDDETKMWESDNKYHNLEYEDVVKFEAALMGALGQLGMDELEKKKKP